MSTTTTTTGGSGTASPDAPVGTTTTPAAQPPPAPGALAPVAPAPPARIPVEFDPSDPVSLYMDTGIFEQLQRVAKLMATSSLVPEHLRSVPKRGDNPGIDRQPDCFLVAAQSFRWRMDPFAVAQHTYVVSGKLGYEGKLIAALINASGKTVANLLPIYSGAEGKPDRKVRIVARLKGEAEDRAIEGTVGDWQTSNERWKKSPDQQLFYRGAREWARRHMPEVLLGISAEEELGETVTLTRSTDGSYGAPRPALEALTDRLESETKPAGGETAGPSAETTEASGGTPPPAREPGSDDDTPAPQVVKDIKAVAAKAGDPAKPRQGRLGE